MAATEELVRFAVANQVPVVIDQRTGARFRVGLLNRSRWNDHGKRIFGPIGGAANLSPRLAERLEREFHVRFERGRDDAIFHVARERVSELLALFGDPETEGIERGARREATEELTGIELKGQRSAILTLEQMREIKFGAPRTVLHDPEYWLSEPGVPAMALNAVGFHFVWDGLAPPDVVQALFSSEYVYHVAETALPEVDPVSGWALAADSAPLAPAIFR